MGKALARTLTTITAATLLSLASGVSPASAATCDNPGDFCVYHDANYAGAWYTFPGADSAWWSGQSAISNGDSSWRNFWSVAVRVYDYASFGNPVTICVWSGQQVNYFAPANDRGMSHKYDGNPSC